MFKTMRATWPDKPPMRCHLLTAAPKRRDQVAGVDDIERLGLQRALEQIVDGKFDVRDPFGVQKRACGIEKALVHIGANHLAGGADPLAEDPKPAQGSAADVQRAQARSVGGLRAPVTADGSPQARLQLQALQL